MKQKLNFVRNRLWYLICKCLNLFICLDRHICRGGFLTYIIIIVGVLLVPLVANWIKGSLDSTLFVDSSISEAYMSYLNPSWTENETPNDHNYKLLIGYLGAFLLNGFLVTLLVSIFQKHRERWEKGEIHYFPWMLWNYSIVIGGNEMVPSLIDQILKEKKRNYVLLMSNRDVPALRKKLHSTLGKKEENVIIYYGERTSKDDLKHLCLQKSSGEIYVIGEQLDISQSGSHHDVKNMDCIRNISNILLQSYCYKLHKLYEKVSSKWRMFPHVEFQKKKCRVMFEYQSTFSVFQFADIQTDISDVIDFRPFNYYETWAQKVMVCQSLIPTIKSNSFLPLEGVTPITQYSEDTVHLIIVGMSRMGIALAVEAAHLAHYPNFITKGKRTRITFIDSDAQREMNFFQGHYKELFSLSSWRYLEFKQDYTFYDGCCKVGSIPWIDSIVQEEHSPYRDKNGYTLGKNLVDIEWQFIKGDLEMPSVQRYIREESLKTDSRLSIAICIPKDNASLAASLYLPDEVYQSDNSVVQVLVYQPFGNSMMDCFAKEKKKNEMKSYKLFSKLRAFGMMDSCYELSFQHELDEISDLIGRQYQKVSKTMRSSLRKKVNSQWSKPETVGKTLAAKQWSNLYNGQHMWTKLRSVGFVYGNDLDKDTIDILSKVEHVRWNVEQLLLGFAPLNASEQIELGKKHGDKEPDIKLDDKGEVLNHEEVSKWLQSWEEFDTRREILKSNMSHVDICSYDRLQEVDSDAMIYDRELVKILPNIYSGIGAKNGSQNPS